MASSNEPNTHDAAMVDSVQSGHWLPALRPERIDEDAHRPMSASPEEGHSPAVASLKELLGESVPGQGISEPVLEPELPPVVADQYMPQPELSNGPTEDTKTQWSGYGRTDIQDDDEMLEDDDDERLDPSWGFKRMSTAQILGSVDRSTTFPSFPTPPANDETLYFRTSGSVPQDTSTDNSLVNGDAHPLSYDSRTNNQEDADVSADEPASTEQELKETPIGASGQGFERDGNDRYEEGVPLVPSAPAEQRPSEDLEPRTAQDQFAAWGEANEDTSFFNNMNSDAQELQSAPALTRKSTGMVFDSLHVHLKEDNTQHDGALESAEMVEADATETMAEPDVEVSEDVWKAMAEDDDFLVEDPDDLLPDSEPGSPSSFIASLQESGTTAQAPTAIDLQQTPPPARPAPNRQSSSNPYAPHQPSTSELAQLSPTTHGSIGLSRPGIAPMGSFQNHLQQRPTAPRAESFADQAKAGYKSPYDLPMELTKPRKRPVVPQLAQTEKPVPPPPRSSSMSDKQLQSPFNPVAPAFPSPSPASQPTPPVRQQRGSASSIPSASSTKPKPGTSSFFEELPMVSKSRTGSGHGRYTPQQSQTMSPPQIHPQSPPMVQHIPSQPHPSPPRQTDPYAQFQLRPPERVDPFTNTPIQPPHLQPAAAAVPAGLSTRYSPAPPATLAGPRPGPSPRYSPAPPSQQTAAPPANRYASQPVTVPTSQAPQISRTISQPPLPQPSAVPTLPFQPRTSSPLAYHKSSIDAAMSGAAPPGRAEPPSQYGQIDAVSPPISGAPPPPDFYSSPPKAVASDGAISGPRRSQTQSPSKQRPRPPVKLQSTEVFARPASAHGQMSPIRTYSQMDSFAPVRHTVQPRGVVDELDLIPPNDETQHDPLQRWKGAPVFCFGFGGSIVSTFPKHIPRYAAGAVRPQIKPTVGEVVVRRIPDVILLPEHLSSFPGPLRVKSKKKDLLAWIGNLVSSLEAETSMIQPGQTLPDPRKCHVEKVLLWRIIKSMVDHDGVLDGNAEALKSINQILAPEVHQVDEATATQYREDVMSPSGTYRPAVASLKADSVDPLAMQKLRKYLLKGARQEAVWFAVDNRLWSHALLIASTLTREVWRQVVQEFVKQEVKVAGDNSESLSAVYEIFGGNVDESVDQLVPPSARAGLQMVSKVDQGGPIKNALDGLDKWRETLTLVINNRSSGDHGALLALGRLLQEYGRIEAAHICFLFARTQTSPAMFGGADDALSSIVLLAADHRKRPFDFARDHESIILTEAYEFAALIQTGSAVSFMPYLSAYKLQRAGLLADSGFKAEAQSYCEALTATMKSTKAPAYYHPTFLGELEEFSNRLKQVPVPSNGSWMAKPSIEKVSGSVWNKFSSFVAGDDSDADSKGSGRDPAESGPFAKVGGTPSLSRHGSQSDIYGAYPGAGPPLIPTASSFAGSRYAPNSMNSARSSSELNRSRPSLDAQRSPPTSSYGQVPHQSSFNSVNMLQQTQMSPPSNPYQSLSYGTSPPTSHYQATPPQGSYMPNTVHEGSPNIAPPRQDSYIPTPPPEQPLINSYEPKSILEQAEQPLLDSPAFGGFVPSPQPQLNEAAPQQFDNSQATSYEPTSQSYGYGYEPPSTEYTPYVPDPDSPVASRPKKQSFMDDDNNDFPSASKPSPPVPSASAPPNPALSSDEQARRAANDAAADAAFRAAAEADTAASKDKQPTKRASGWFGGWLGGGGAKKDSLDTGAPAAPAKGADGKPVYRAKLGESKMKLYYDDKLKKWVNPDNPDAASGAAKGTPPPPRAGPPMGAGMGMGPPRSVSAMAPPTSSPALNLPSPMGPSPVLGGSGPPSRAGTPASGASGPIAASLPPSIRPSLVEGSSSSPNLSGPGAPSLSAPGLGVASAGLAPPSRPSTAMSNASSIDDLLGAPGQGMGRKSVKGKKGGRAGRYVDVMAK